MIPPNPERPIRIGGKFEVEVELKGDRTGVWSQALSLLDTGSQLNLLTFEKIKEMELTPTGRPAPAGHMYEGVPITLAGEYLKRVRVTDSSGTVKEIVQFFYGCKPMGYDIILGTPWLATHCGCYDWAAAWWKYTT